jgi:hypothetical protein
VCYQGKFKVIPELMWMRSDELSGIRGTDVSLIPENTFRNWWEDPGRRVEHLEFLTIMGATLAHADNQANEVVVFVRKAIDEYLQTMIDGQQSGVINSFRKKIISFLPKSWKNTTKRFLKYITMQFLDSKETSELQKVVSVLEVSGVEIDLSELSIITSIIAEFHTKNQIA